MKIYKENPLLLKSKLPSSKSFLNRILILSCLLEDEVIIDNFLPAQDVVDLINVLEQVGIIFEYPFPETIKVCNSFPACEQKTDQVVILHSGAGGTTNRFLLPFLALGENRYQLQPHSRLLERPMEQMWKTLQKCHVKLETTDVWPVIQGPLQLPSILEIDVTQTSQIASAFSLIRVVKDFKLIVPSNFASQGYFGLTDHLVYRCQQGDRCFRTPVDFSSLGYLIAYGVYISPITISGILAIDHFQPDAQLISILRNAGAHIELGCSGINVRPSEIRALELDCSVFPDLVPTLVFIASYAVDISVLWGIKNLRYKETDRINEMLNILKLFNVRAEYQESEDRLTIFPAKPIVEAKTYISVDDHRMALMAMLFMYKNEGGEIKNFECVVKSFPSLLN